MHLRLAAAVACNLFFALTLAVAQTNQPFSVPPDDAPQLSARGPYSVGVRTVQTIHRDQVNILDADKQTGKAPIYDRPLLLEIWYPATIPAGQVESTTYQMNAPGRTNSGGPIEVAGKALRDAAPVTGTRFPLVIVSHGYPGSRFFLTYLTENLASKGYIVVAIDHTDSVFGNVRDFSSTLLNRSADQLFTIQTIAELATTAGHFLNGIVDSGNVAIIGYSMGGYGSLISAGAGLNPASPLLNVVPGNYLVDWTADSAKFKNQARSGLKAIVAIAPWGEQPPYNAWNESGLSAILVPSLFIAGDQDDVADFARGIKPAFEHSVHSERYLLIYKDARHNTGGNPAPPGRALDYSAIQSFDEPVWRKDRITSINQHFITAFLDLYLKHEESRSAFLNLPIPNSNDGKWSLPPGTEDSDARSTGHDSEGNAFWTGFQRRWALGLELIRASQQK